MDRIGSVQCYKVDTVAPNDRSPLCLEACLNGTEIPSCTPKSLFCGSAKATEAFHLLILLLESKHLEPILMHSDWAASAQAYNLQKFLSI